MIRLASLVLAGAVFTAATLVAVDQAAGRASAPPAPTFARDVAPILYKHCTTCHRPGEIGPMSLITYDEARPWARAIRDKVLNGAMPPWHANAERGRFANDRRMSDAEREVVSKWVAAGAPNGQVSDLPPAPVYPAGWTIGTPDAVVSMAEPFAVPAQGEVKYQYVEIATNFTQDKWVQAIEVRPGSRPHVHHVLTFARDPKQTPRGRAIARPIPYPGPPPPASLTGGAAGPSAARRGPLLANMAPGTNAMLLPPGRAMLVRAGSVLTLQIHYTTNGTAAEDRTSVGFVFAKEPPATEVRATNMINARFAIPPGAADYAVPSGFEFLQDVTIYSLLPHTHLRGKSWEYRVIYPDGRNEVILSVPKYDFNWQTDYVFAQPLRIPKGARLEAVARYDNSPANKANPDPKAEVIWGDQTWEEMQYTAILYSVDPISTTSQR